MDAAKPWYQSTTIIGLLVSILGWVLVKFHVTLGSDVLTDYITNGMEIIGAIVAFIGRLISSTKVTATAAKADAINAAAK